MSNTKHTPGPWEVAVYGMSPETVEKLRECGIEPTRILTNDGQVPIMAGAGEDKDRIALVDCQTVYKRGQGHKAECEVRDANARLIAAAPTMYDFIEAKAKAGDSEAIKIMEAINANT